MQTITFRSTVRLPQSASTHHEHMDVPNFRQRNEALGSFHSYEEGENADSIYQEPLAGRELDEGPKNRHFTAEIKYE